MQSSGRVLTLPTEPDHGGNRSTRKTFVLRFCPKAIAALRFSALAISINQFTASRLKGTGRFEQREGYLDAADDPGSIKPFINEVNP